MPGNELVKWSPPSAERLFKLLGSAPKGAGKAPWWKRILGREFKHPTLASTGAGALLGGGGFGLISALQKEQPKRGKKETKGQRKFRIAGDVVGGAVLGGMLGRTTKGLLDAVRSLERFNNKAPLTHSTPMGSAAWNKVRDLGSAHFRGPAGDETIVGVAEPILRGLGKARVREMPKREAWDRLARNEGTRFGFRGIGPTDAAATQLFDEIGAGLRAGARAAGAAAPAKNPAEQLVQRLRGLGYDTNKLMQTLHPDRFAAAGLNADEAELLRKGFIHARAGGKGGATTGPFFGLGKQLKELQDKLEHRKKGIF